MPVVPASKHIPGSWDCGLRTELGWVSFSALVAKDPWHPRVENHYHLKLLRASQYFSKFSCEKHELIHSFSTVTCQVTRSREIEVGRKCYLLLNCLVRVKCFLNLNRREKELFLAEFSGGLFNTYNKLLVRERRLLETKPHIRFNRNTGFPLTNRYSLKLAVKTLSFEVSDLPFSDSDPYCADGAATVFGDVKVLELDAPKTGSGITQSNFSRAVAETMIPAPLQKLVLEGVCYNPGSKFVTVGGKEHWCLHIHKPCESNVGMDDARQEHPDCFGGNSEVSRVIERNGMDIGTVANALGLFFSSSEIRFLYILGHADSHAEPFFNDLFCGNTEDGPRYEFECRNPKGVLCIRRRFSGRVSCRVCFWVGFKEKLASVDELGDSDLELLDDGIVAEPLGAPRSLLQKYLSDTDVSPVNSDSYWDSECDF